MRLNFRTDLAQGKVFDKMSSQERSMARDSIFYRVLGMQPQFMNESVVIELYNKYLLMKEEV